MLSLVPTIDLHSNTETLHLVHPRTNTVCKFRFDANSRKLFEVQSVTRGTLSDGSFLVGTDALFHSTKLSVQTRIDPFFLLLPGLIAAVPSSGPFTDFIEVLNLVIEQSPFEEARAGMTRLAQVLNESCSFRSLLIEKFCDHRSVLDRIMVRVNDEKVMTFLKKKLEALETFIIRNQVYLVEASSGDPGVLNRVVALELLRSYISERLYEAFSKEIGINTDALFREVEEVVEVKNEGAKKRPNAAAAGQPTAKKAKEIAVAKSCMKMTAFFKPANQ